MPSPGDPIQGSIDHHRSRHLLAALAGMVAFVLILAATTPRGPAIAPDSTSYLNAAESLVREGALRQPYGNWDDPRPGAPLTDYAPGYPLLLALPVAAGVAPQIAARWTQALATALTLVLVVELLGAIAGTGTAVAGALALLAMPAMTTVHLWVLSEPLFILFVTATVAALTLRPGHPLLHGTLAALADLSRFAGIFLVGAVTLWHLIRPGTRRERLTRAAWAVAPGTLMQLWWRLHGVSPGGGVSLESFAGLGSAFVEGGRTFERWLVPGVADGAVRVVLALLLAGGLAWIAVGVLRSAGAGRRPFLQAIGVTSGCYLGMLLFARLHVVSDVPFDDRILAPLLVLLTIGTVAVLGWQLPTWSVPGRATALALSAGWVIGAVGHDARAISAARRYGLGYEAAEWTRSPVSRWLADSSAGQAIYTNDPAGVWAVTGRESRLLPSSLDPDTLRAFAARFASAPSLIAGYVAPFVTTAPPDSLARGLGLRQVARSAEGTVWVSTGGPSR